MNEFGKFVKARRFALRIGLREFCLKAECDPSNWSKIERGQIPPLKDKSRLALVAFALEFYEESEEWNRLFDLAAIDAGRIPDFVMSDKDLAKRLPVFFRTAAGRKPTGRDCKKIVETLRGNQ